ncbi:MAG TPA: ubiquitin-like protein Pup [Candidatus Acidoferrum sp.]|nr:ubiquitin-like protein Pup [Candidatus Acidoferrum sp.]
MAVQEQKQHRPERPSSDESSRPSAQVIEAGKKLKADLDRLVDDIDDILTENAEEFVKSYVQRGGE